ncbi:hypothetical protein Tco_0021676 [Tanacetum coccineum]
MAHMAYRPYIIFYIIAMLTPSEQYSQWCRRVLDRYPHSNCLRSSGNGANSPEKVSNWSSKYANAFI